MYKFSIVSYFDADTTKDIRDIQESLAEITRSQGALSAWNPHITVGSGLIVEENQLEDFYNKIETFLKTVSSMKLKTKDFGFIDNWSGSKLGFSPYVVYIKPYDIRQLSQVADFFEKELKVLYPAWYDQPWPYGPHITLAYKDLTEEGYNKAKEYLSGKIFEKEIAINNVCLAVSDESGIWKEFKRFSIL